MGILEALTGTVVGLDTAPLIYFIEKNPRYHPHLRGFFVALAAGQFAGVTSTITLLETLVQPIRNNHHEIAERYREILLNTPHLIMFDISPEIAQKAAEIRANFSVRTPDAIQLAAALHGGATFFLTNDLALQKFNEIKVIVVDDLG
jgi:predicted nucleic acid-binding protein